NPGSFANRVTCGSTGRTCIQQEATCTNGACVCKEIHEEAKGDFRCYQDKSMVCELKSDPSLRTFSGEVENFPFPCRYMVTHVRTDLKNKFGDLIGTCESKVFGFNGKADGKYIVLGFDVQIKIMYTNPAKSVISTFRHSATAINNANSVSLVYGDREQQTQKHRQLGQTSFYRPSLQRQRTTETGDPQRQRGTHYSADLFYRDRNIDS
ncbi:hypothetical protein RRG08_067362, partial [Elysia crispata]